MRKLVVGLLALMLGLASLSSAYVSQRWLDGAEGWKEGMGRHQQLEAPLLVYFRTDWCPHCQRFDEMLAEPEVRKGLERMMKVVMNPENSPEEQRLFREAYGLDAFPALVLHPADGSAPRRLSHRGPAEKFLRQFDGSAGDRERPRPPVT